jgi:hypothetical protein
VDLARPHRIPSLFEHSYHGLEHWAHLGWSRPRFARIVYGSVEQLGVERAEPRELNLGSRV